MCLSRLERRQIWQCAIAEAKGVLNSSGTIPRSSTLYPMPSRAACSDGRFVSQIPPHPSPSISCGVWMSSNSFPVLKIATTGMGCTSTYNLRQAPRFYLCTYTHLLSTNKRHGADLASVSVHDGALLKREVALADVGPRLAHVLAGRDLRERLDFKLFASGVGGHEARVLDHEHGVGACGQRRAGVDAEDVPSGDGRRERVRARREHFVRARWVARWLARTVSMAQRERGRAYAQRTA